MTARSTRNKLRFQCKSAAQDLEKAQRHLTELAALADDHSGYIDENLPVIMVALESVKLTLIEFYEGL